MMFIGFFGSPKHVVELSFYVKTWLQETTFLVLVCFESVCIKEITNVWSQWLLIYKDWEKFSCFDNILSAGTELSGTVQ